MYIIMELSDAKLLASQVTSADEHTRDILNRIEAETGADIEDIVLQLKAMEPCHACVVESQQEYCICWRGNKLGRRLSRLIDRARMTR